jgi:hypothetical protein
MDVPVLAAVDPLDTLRGVAGTMDVPVLGNVRDTDTLRTVAGTLLSNKILKSNTTGDGAGNYDDDNLVVGNVRPVAFALGLTGDLTNLAAGDAAYIALEATRNNDNGTIAADILTGKSVKVKSATISGTFDEAARNITAGAGNILLGAHEHIQGAQIDGIFDEASRNVSAGAGNILLGQHEHIQGAQIDGTWVKADKAFVLVGHDFGVAGSEVAAFDEVARNTTLLETQVQNLVPYNSLGVGYTGSYNPLVAAVFPTEGCVATVFGTTYGPTGVEYTPARTDADPLLVLTGSGLYGDPAIPFTPTLTPIFPAANDTWDGAGPYGIPGIVVFNR